MRATILTKLYKLSDREGYPVRILIYFPKSGSSVCITIVRIISLTGLIDLCKGGRLKRLRCMQSPILFKTDDRESRNYMVIFKTIQLQL